MKHLLLTTIAAVVLVGCSGPPPKDIWEAAKQGDVDAVKQFIVAGEDVNAKGGEWDMTPLHLAVREGHKEIVEILIAEGAPLNAKGVGGFTPLHLAAEEGHKAVADLLISNGADVNAKNEYGSTPLFYATADGQKEIAELLIAKGAEVNAKASNGTLLLTPLDSAIKRKHTETANLLRKHGAKTAEELKAEGK